MSESLKIGKIITEPQSRDAIHMAVAPVVANETLSRGQRVGVVDNVASAFLKPVGIVDPFLDRDYVAKGQQFWIFLFPGSITSLHHQWEHPGFKADDGEGAKKMASVKWLEGWCEEHDITAEKLTEAIRNGGEIDDPSRYHGDGEDPEMGEEFWEHYERATGQIVGEDQRQLYYSCCG